MIIYDGFLQEKIHSDTVAYLFTMTLIRTYENHNRKSLPGGHLTLYLLLEISEYTYIFHLCLTETQLYYAAFSNCRN